MAWSRFNQILREAVTSGGEGGGAGGVEVAPVVPPAVPPAALAAPAVEPATPSLVAGLRSKLGLVEQPDGSLVKVAPASAATPGGSNGQANPQVGAEGGAEGAEGGTAAAASTPATPTPEIPAKPFSFDDIEGEGGGAEGDQAAAAAADGDSAGKDASGEGDTSAEAGEVVAAAVDPTTPTPTPEDTAALAELKTLLEDSTDLSDEKLKSIQTAFLATSRGKRQLQAFKLMRDLSQPIVDGGIGVEPTQDDVKSWYGSHRQLDAIRYGMESGDTGDAINSLTALLGSSTDASLPPPPAVNTVVGQLIPYLVNNHPELYREHISAPVRKAVVGNFTKFVQDLPRGADGSDDRKYSDAAIFSVRLLQERMFGHSQPVEAFINGSAGVGASKPKSSMELENERLRNQINTQATTQSTTAEGEFYNGLEFDVRTSQERLADYALAPLARQHGKDSDIYLGTRDRFIAAAVKSVQANPEFSTQFTRDINRAWNTIKRSLSTTTPVTPAQHQQAKRDLVMKLDRVTKSAMANLRSRFVGTAAVAATPPNRPSGSPSPSHSTAQPGVNGSSVGQPNNPQPSQPNSVTVTAPGQSVPVGVAAGVGTAPEGVTRAPGQNAQQAGAAFLRGRMGARIGQSG